MLLSTGEQVSVALMAMAIHSLGAQGGQPDRGPDRHPHRQHAHQGPHPVDLDRAHAASCSTKATSSSRPASRASTRISTSPRSAAAAATPRPWPWRPCCRPTPARSTPTSTASTRPIRGCCPRPGEIKRDQLRRDARAGQPGRGRDAQPLDRVRQEVRRADPRPQQLQRRAGHDDRRRAGIGRPGRSAARRSTKNEARITIAGVPDRPGTSLAIFSKIAAQEHRGRHDRAERRRRRQGRHLVHRAARRSAGHARSRRRSRGQELGAEGVSHDDDVAKVSVVGLGMATQTGVAERMFRALADAGVNIEMITTSEIKISVLVDARPGASGAADGAPGVRAGQSRRRDRVEVRRQRPQRAATATPSTSSPGCSGWKT